ncbi:hypothetical protein TPHA_0L00430 [Tetrapisispora phaffii CBS 4417]|uniref:LDB19 N-terminal domain-containing protein n=1 Tax=Tetrapisispora phaffii (strain ATCC 24235 / CBS 4417 / NBRC 1672 / NRRL Y-8282 / UCD 70-5) TaxID=1071381 RepID=G8BZS1_TETPH|nr:hypothetical protein TPHA_0L00430 [Tetrapisispora phaffii CBS 4417]CCE65399.1 hypothetical protein TPHA_0L00430 [Tetrapisispora phaffii CBS 4417]
MVFRSFLPLSSSSKTSSGRNQASVEDTSSPEFSPVKVAIEVESPPCVLYGNALDSRGAVLNGLLRLKIKDPYSNVPFADASLQLSNLNGLTLSDPDSDIAELTKRKIDIFAGYTKVTITSVHLKMIQIVKYSKPFLPGSTALENCDNCNVKVNTMKRWPIQEKDADFTVGTYEFPFSYLIPGSVPATCALGANSETQIKYKLVAEVFYNIPFKNSPKYGDVDKLELEMPIAITRSITRGPDKNSLRVFPPTELTAAAVIPNVIHPKSTFPLELKIDGISSTDRRWRMRKLNWKIEETTRVRGYSCRAHKNDLNTFEKAIQLKEEEKKKKKHVPIKRYGDIGPRITVSLGNPNNMPFKNNNKNNTNRGGDATPDRNENPTTVQNPRDRQTNSSLSSNTINPQGDHDDDDYDEPNEFIHPSDDAMRQEVEQQQEIQRQKQIQHELESEISLFTEEVRVLSSGEMKKGWKTDFNNNGHIDIVTEINCMSLNSGLSNHLRYVSTARSNESISTSNPVTISCDIQDPILGIYVSHLLSVELVVAEEALQYANGQPLENVKKSDKPRNSSSSSSKSEDQRLAELSPMFANRSVRSRPIESDEDIPSISDNSTNSTAGSKGTSNNMKIVSVPTGAARVLRMQFRLVVTERSGLGISWEDEVPPLYQDVKSFCPPDYAKLIQNHVVENVKTSVLETEYIDSAPEYGLQINPQLPQTLLPPPQARHHKSIHRSQLSPLDSFY